MRRARGVPCRNDAKDTASNGGLLRVGRTVLLNRHLFPRGHLGGHLGHFAPRTLPLCSRCACGCKRSSRRCSRWCTRRCSRRCSRSARRWRTSVRQRWTERPGPPPSWSSILHRRAKQCISDLHPPAYLHPRALQTSTLRALKTTLLPHPVRFSLPPDSFRLAKQKETGKDGIPPTRKDGNTRS